MKRLTNILALFISILITSCSHHSINLEGNWKFQMDQNNIGESEKWFTKDLYGEIILPGSMASNDLGDEITMETQWTGGMRNPNWSSDPNYSPYHNPDNIRIPYWLQPEKKYTGASWYQREVNIPKSWKGNSLQLFLERAHWETTVWYDDNKVGTQNSLGTPHEYILTDKASSGKHILTIRVDNSTKDVDVGRDSHSISDHTQSNWNGLVGELKISPLPSVQIRDIVIYSDIVEKSIVVKGDIFNSGHDGKKAKVKGKVDGTGLKAKFVELKINISPGSNSFSMKIELGEEALLWDEFDPNLYTLNLSVAAGREHDTKNTSFGLRKIEASSSGFKINNRPAFLRGTLECAIFPLTGYPSTDPGEWKRIMKVIKAHGLNHMRFHSWCPPEAAFIAADEIGIYLQVECSSWANSTSSIGDGRPIDKFIWDESKSIIKNYGNHPSFVMMAYGNEPAGKNQIQFLTEFVSYWKKNDPRRLYTSAGGWPRLEVNDYHNIPQPRIQGWGEQLNSIINAQAPKTSYDWTPRLPEDGIPVVSHEIGQWCVYPNLKEQEKYTGVLKARNFEIFEESLEANHMGHLADSFLIASGKLQALCYKADIEAALRTPTFGGFQLLDLHDFPGQGTALVGVLDPFWEEKGYISPEEFSQFCNSTVPLARLTKRIFQEGETIEVPVQVAHYGNAELRMPKAEWSLINAGGRMQKAEVVAVGEFEPQTIPLGNDHYLGTIKHTFKKTGAPRKLSLEVSVANFKNTWDIWIYPKIPELTSEQSERELTRERSERELTTVLTPEIINFLETGGTVLLSLGKGKVAPEEGGQVGVGFSSIFWNTAWTAGQKPHTLGILCNPDHPALAQFPTEFHSNWQWWDAMSHSDAIKLNDFPVELNPIVRIIDDWVSNRSLALLFEAKVGKGKILVSGIDLHTDLENRLEAKQLLHSLTEYMNSDQFDPQVEIRLETLEDIVVW